MIGVPEPRAQRLADGVALLSAWVLLAGIPVLMVFANRGSAAALTFASGLLLLAVLLDPRLGLAPVSLAKRLVGALARPIPMLIMVLVVLALIGIPKTQHPAFNLLRLVEFLIPVLITAIFLVLNGLRVLPLSFVALAAGLVGAILLVQIELHGGSTLRAFFGLRGEPWRLNRTVVCLVTYLPALMMLARNRREQLFSVLLAGMIAVTSIQSESGASALGFSVFLTVTLLAYLVWRATAFLVFGATMLAVMTAPFHGHLLEAMIPVWMHERMRSVSSAIRVGIYQAYEAAIYHAPIFGSGFNAGARFRDEPGFLIIPPALQHSVEFGHPHNAALQLWLELGFAGAVLVMSILILLAREMGRLPSSIRPPALGFFAMIVAISLVSHGAWQAWWVALAGLGIVITTNCVRLGARSPNGARL
ncbi:O-antigen ligase-related [Rhabdaerophilaceae bacterium]